MMAITVSSSASTPTNSAQLLSGTASSDNSASAGGFAELLFSQLSGAVTGIIQPQASASLAKEKTSSEKETSVQENLTASDPALAFMMAAPGVQAPIVAAPQPNLDNAPTTDTARSSLTGLQDSTAKGRDGTSSMFEAAKRSLPASTAQGPAITDEKVPSNQGNTGNTNTAFQNLLTPPANGPVVDKGKEGLGLPANIAVESAPPQETAPLAAATGTPPSKLEASATSKTEVAAPLHSNAWNNEFASKVVWLAKNDQQQAHININPPQLGPIQITLQINGDQAAATFGSANAEVRQAIESSLPQLKEMLSSAGINLGQADVGANFAQQNREAPYQSTNGNRLANENAILPGDGSIGESKRSTPIQRGSGLVDLFA